MANTDLVSQVLVQMTRLGVTQVELATHCQLSQPHLSKVLANKVKLARKTSEKLTDWLASSERVSGAVGSDGAVEYVQQFAQRLAELRPNKYMQIMQLLNAIEQIIID